MKNLGKLHVSIGIIAYNEELNLGTLLSQLYSQSLSNVEIAEIIVISDGSVDKTNGIIQEFASRDKRIVPVIFKVREGKCVRVNQLFRKAREDIIVMLSADIRIREDSIEGLCTPLKEKGVEMTIARPIPVNSGSSLWGQMIHLHWLVHHRMAQLSPKATEMVAFRKDVSPIPKTTVDEEYILSQLSGKGKILYMGEICFQNKGPTRKTEYISQIRRNYSGHLQLRKQYSKEIVTANNLLGIAIALKESRKYWKALPIFIFFQSVGRLLGLLDYMTGKTDVLWNIASTTKSLDSS